jgi:hypothetical protein
VKRNRKAGQNPPRVEALIEEEEVIPIKMFETDKINL